MPESTTTVHPTESPPMPRVLCFGEALINRTVGNPPAQDQPGGAAANVACGVALLGTPSAFLGRLGDDAEGHQLAELFTARRVNTDALQWDGKRPTRIRTVQRDDHGLPRDGAPQTRPDDGFADEAVVPAALAEAVMPLLGDARWLVVGTGTLSRLTGAMALNLLLRRATARGVSIALEVDWRPECWGLATGSPPPAEVLRRFLPLAEAAALIRCSPEEALQFFGTEDPAAIHAALPKRPAVLITDGLGGVRWCLGGRTGSLRAFSADTLDPTGAGHAFLAGLLHGLCREPMLLGSPAPGGEGIADPAPIEELLRRAVACATLAGDGSGCL